MSDSDDAYGPPLPPGFGSGSKSVQPTTRGSSSDSDSDMAGPSLPPGFRRGHTKTVDEEDIGPALPLHLRKEDVRSKKEREDSETSRRDDDGRRVIGPAFPLSVEAGERALRLGKGDVSSEEDTFGPCLPPGFARKKSSSSSAVAGPSLPPHLRGSSEEDAAGSLLPPHMRGGRISNASLGTSSSSSGVIGPRLPSHLRTEVGSGCQEEDDEEDEGDVVGPSPLERFTGSSAEYTAAMLERRAQEMKDKLTNKKQDEGPMKREAWMTELPPEMSGHIGLTARTFRKRSRPQNTDRSVWTDTPAEKARKEREGGSGSAGDDAAPKLSAEQVAGYQKDRVYADMIEEYNKSNRAESLLEMHKKEKKKKKKKGKDKEKPKERRPFDRDLDLQVNRFDDAQRKVMIKRAQGFNSRFQAGQSTSQFL